MNALDEMLDTSKNLPGYRERIYSFRASARPAGESAHISSKFFKLIAKRLNLLYFKLNLVVSLICLLKLLKP
jgi:hypothetical protein